MTFFLVVNPGLEELALAEFREKWNLLTQRYGTIYSGSPPVPKVTVERGGLTFEAEAAMVWPLNVYLKIPTRILQRLGNFTARDYIKLFNMIAKMPWHDYLRMGDVEVEVSYHQSALNRKERLKDTVLQALAEASKRRPFRKAFLPTPQIIFLRMMDDVATLSIDLSGEPLYKRGYKEHSVEAPLRETLGAAMWYQCQSGVGLQKDRVLADPMCGSGTLLSEAALFYHPAKRAFAFENFPMAPQVLPPQKWVPIHPDGAYTELTLLGSDSSEKAIEATRNNFNKAGLKGDLKVSAIKDLESASADVVLCNPPYGDRLAMTRQQMDSLLPLIALKFNPKVISVIVPENQAGLKLPNGYQPLKPPLKTFNGGLRVQVLTIGRKN